MALRIRLQAVPETLQELESAAEERFEEGRNLLTDGYFGPSINILGYAGEIFLKTAYFRAIRHPRPANPNYEIRAGLNSAMQVGSALISQIEPEGFHSIRFWAMLIQATRLGQSRALRPAFTLDFEARTESLYNNWWAEMRYRQVGSPVIEARQVLADVAWLRVNRPNLWR